MVPLSRRQFVVASSAGLAAGGFAPEAHASETPKNPGPHREPSDPADLAHSLGGQLRRVIIDTDPGVDDALALLFAMCSPELKIEAITPVAGNVPLDLTLPNALRMVEIAARTDIPVAAGARVPLARQLVTARYAHGTNGLGGLEFPAPKTRPVEEPAAEMIHRIVSGSPGEVSIIPIGPLTNIAAVLRAYPSAARQIREIVLMGGSLSGGNMTPAAEFNMYVDPEAASIVFGSGVPLTMVGLDVTEKCVLSEQHVKMLESGSGPISQAAARIGRNALERARKADWGGPAMHDPLAVATFIDKSIVHLRKCFVAIETRGEFTAGATVGYKEAPIRRSAPDQDSVVGSEITSSTLAPNTDAAVDVDAARFFEMFISRLSGHGR